MLMHRQYCNRGLGMDKELLPWLETYTFPEEAKFSDQEYARLVYGAFVKRLMAKWHDAKHLVWYDS